MAVGIIGAYERVQQVGTRRDRFPAGATSRGGVRAGPNGLVVALGFRREGAGGGILGSVAIDIGPYPRVCGEVVDFEAELLLPQVNNAICGGGIADGQVEMRLRAGGIAGLVATRLYDKILQFAGILLHGCEVVSCACAGGSAIGAGVFAGARVSGFFGLIAGGCLGAGRRCGGGSRGRGNGFRAGALAYIYKEAGHRADEHEKHYERRDASADVDYFWESSGVTLHAP